MKEFFSVICSSKLFSGVSENELAAMLACLDPKVKDFRKEAFVLRCGDTVDSIGLVLSGSVLIVQDDIWGNRNILSKAEAGTTFATAFACAPGSKTNVDVIAETPVTVMFLDVNRILNDVRPLAIITPELSETCSANLPRKICVSAKNSNTWGSVPRVRKLRPIFPRKQGGSELTNLIFRFQDNNLRIISESSAVGCRRNWAKCVTNALSISAKTISF